MVWDHYKHRFVGRGGQMLGSMLRSLATDGEVTLFSQYDWPKGVGDGPICGLCANGSVCLTSLEFQRCVDLVTSTRVVTGSLCLPLCTDCSRMLTECLKTTQG